MVLKKPYAFLIKHFKLLHLILFGLMVYLSVKINLITNLFNRLATGTGAFSGVSEQYIDAFMYLVIIIILFGLFVVWFLMKNKEKPTKFYLSSIVYYVILFVFLIVCASALRTLAEVSMTNQELRIYRDISFLLPLGQYYFIVIVLLRGIGFNIKQFNFSKDIKDLEISDKDSEEIEVNLSSNTYKYRRFGRKRLRELKYYFFENKFWICIILGIILVIGLIFFFVNYKFVNNNYSEGSSVSASYYRFSVNNTYVTENDLYGNVVQSGKKYVIVDISVRNNYYEVVNLDIKSFRLFIGNDFYYPISNKNSDFKDLGLPYDNKSLALDKDYNYILVYEISSEQSTNGMKLKVYNKMDYESAKVDYVNISLKPKKLNDKKLEQEVGLNENIKFENDKYLNSLLVVSYFDLVNKYEYNYDMCVGNDCSKKTGVIIPDDVLNNMLLEIDYSLSIDDDSSLNNFIKNDDTFFNTFVTLTYKYNGKEKVAKFVGISNKNVSDKIFMEVSKDIVNADEIKIFINTRSDKFSLKLR